MVKETHPLNRWNHDHIQPTNTGSVGDVLTAVRLKQSSPDMAWKIEPWTTQITNGSKITRSARTSDSRWATRKSYVTNYGIEMQDLRVPDTSVQPFLESTGTLAWANIVATIDNVKTRGQRFLPLPGGYPIPETSFYTVTNIGQDINAMDHIIGRKRKEKLKRINK
jgi:hypothetical protein